MTNLQSLLVANRGEIAVRVIRSAKELGMRTIAIYSDLDRDALHVQLADEAWNVGGAPASESYLDADRIIQVALESGADSVHPGYGFLAENAGFAQQVIDAGITWVGPPPAAIATMGDKIASRKAAEAAEVPTVPGTLDPLSSPDDIARVADDYGYPVAIKAAHGGGGKGLRVVSGPEELEQAFEGARREADAYFGNAEVYVEKYLVMPRHIEAQIIVDAEGRGVFLGERDCSVQRRHQKLIEEAPSAVLTHQQRAALGEAALRVAGACGYRNAGTVEFLLDQAGDFYFLEMNTRLQVEHTVTEMVTGLDLVAEQLRVAGGEPLSIDPSEVVPLNGHAIEFRINAENPAKNFLPNPGQVVEYREPSGYGVRVDGWMQPGASVSQYYDNLMAKLIVWGRTRDEAIRRGRRALSEYHITGVATTIPAHLYVLEHPTFIDGEHHTRFMEDEVDPSDLSASGAPAVVASPASTREDLDKRAMRVEVGGKLFDVTYWAEGGTGAVAGSQPRPTRSASTSPAGRSVGGSSDEPGIITAPMQGTIVKVAATPGDSVVAGATLLVLEAMKMENEVQSPIDGELVDCRVSAGDTVSPGDVLAIVR